MKLRWHLFAVTLVALAIGLLFLQEPVATTLCWASPSICTSAASWLAKASRCTLAGGACAGCSGDLGPGLVSYYGGPLLYLAGG
jgi:hypothetical protein